MERMLAGVATRRHVRTAEPVGEQVAEAAKSMSKSAVSRRFVKQTETALAAPGIAHIERACGDRTRKWCFSCGLPTAQPRYIDEHWDTAACFYSTRGLSSASACWMRCASL
jgi:hypothetical protein